MLGLGVPPTQIIYANTIKAPSHLMYAVSRGVSLMTFDSHEELLKIKELAPHTRYELQWPNHMFGFSHKQVIYV